MWEDGEARALALVAALALVGLPACGAAGRTQLVAAGKTRTGSEGEGRGTATVEGVRVEARGEPWPGRQRAVLEHVTPLRVRIENDGAHPIQIRYRQFALTTPNGARRFAAIPPFQVHGEIEQSVGFTPGFDHGGFAVAPYYRGYYHGMTVWREPFLYDDPYDDEWAGYWRQIEIELPTEEMLEVALPEGVVERGGYVEGFLYFQHVPDRIGRVVLRADVTTTDGERLGTIELPFLARD